MREPPAEVDDDDLLTEVRRSWDADVDRVSYLPVGFGGHHWTAFVAEVPRLFVTYDPRAAADGLADLEAALAGTMALSARGLEFVLAPLGSGAGGPLVAFADGALSCTPWRDGVSDEPLDVTWTRAALGRLHATEPPPGLRPWRPRVDPDFPEKVTSTTSRDWGPGPYADQARSDVVAHLGDIARWTERYHLLADAARSRSWVVTHGEPHEANQLRTDDGRFLVDWDTLRLAPAEVDLQVLVHEGVPPGEVGADGEMLELFDLEWRLDEISQYAAWFAAQHTGTRDDEIAFEDLRHELERPERRW